MKRLKAAVDYGKGMQKAHCGICRHFIPPHSCARVHGSIARTAWCKLFVTMKKVA